MKESNDWNATKYNKSADFVSKLALPLVELLHPQKQEKILDLGCGEGSLALEIQKYGSRVIGVDLSADMINKAKFKGVEAYQMEATALAFSKEFDAVFSNAVLHWVKDAPLAIAQVEKVLKPKGRFVGEFGGVGNIQALREAIKRVFKRHKEYGEFDDPWFFPTTEEYTTLLQDRGFKVKQIELIVRPTSIGDIKEWLEIFANGIMQNIPRDAKESFKNEVEELLKEKLYTQKDGWIVDYVRLQFVAIKTGEQVPNV